MNAHPAPGYLVQIVMRYAAVVGIGWMKQPRWLRDFSTRSRHEDNAPLITTVVLGPPSE
jgi:hypothetical protein